MRRALAFAAALLFTLPASAEPTDAEKDAARILFTEGKELRDSGKIVPALERFQRAYELAATPITTLEYARTHAMLGHLVEARRLYRSIDAMEKKPSESAKSVAARDEARQLATDLDAKIPTVVVKVLPEGEKLEAASLDGKPLEVASLSSPLAVDPGKHVLAVRAKTDGSTTFVAAEGERDRAITVELPRAAPPPPLLPKPKPEVPTPVVVRTSPLVWIGGIAGGVGLIVGAGAGALALSSASSVKDNCQNGVCPPSRHDDLDNTRTWATVSTIGFGVAAVGATLFVVGLASPSTKKDVAAPSVVPYASLGGFGFTGRF